jgi:hypothetical protein
MRDRVEESGPGGLAGQHENASVGTAPTEEAKEHHSPTLRETRVEEQDPRSITGGAEGFRGGPRFRDDTDSRLGRKSSQAGGPALLFRVRHDDRYRRHRVSVTIVTDVTLSGNKCLPDLRAEWQD